MPERRAQCKANQRHAALEGGEQGGNATAVDTIGSHRSERRGDRERVEAERNDRGNQSDDHPLERTTAEAHESAGATLELDRSGRHPRVRFG